MDIRGRISPRNNLAYFECQIKGVDPSFSIPVSFVADTGASRTAILYKDADRISPHLNFDALEPFGRPLFGIGGKVQPYLLKDITITFKASEPPEHQESIDSAFVFKDLSKSEAERNDLFTMPSVIGMDILKRYQLIFQGDEALFYT